MITRSALADYLQQLLACEQYNDYAPNGLQVEGASEIKKICTAVTASAAVIDSAAKQNADALLVHHGFFWRGEQPEIQGMKRVRIGALMQHDINLFAYHLPLDCHLELGNNACLGKLLSIQDAVGHKIGSINNLLWSGLLPKPQKAEGLQQQLQQVFKRQPLVIAGHERPVHKIAWCTGGAQDYIETAALLGADAYISGEISERTYYQAKELKINYYACGHHATERYGIQALGLHLANQFSLEHLFIDSDNPV